MDTQDALHLVEELSTAQTPSVIHCYRETVLRDKVRRVGQLIVRKVDAELIQALKTRAAHKCRFAEAEHREILAKHSHRVARAERSKTYCRRCRALAMAPTSRDRETWRSPDRGSSGTTE